MHTSRRNVNKKRVNLMANSIPTLHFLQVPQVREAYDNKGYSPIPNRIENCRTYPLYKLVRNGLKTQLLTGLRTISPGQEIEKVYDAICEGKHVAPLLQCLEGWSGAPGPFSC